MTGEMSKARGLPKDVSRRLREVQEADLLVGIPSYNNARTIGHVVRAAQAGLAKYFPGYKAVLVNSDGGSSDGTMEVVRKTAIEDFRSILVSHSSSESFFKIATPYSGPPGKGSAFRTIFEVADALQVKACVVVDSDLRSITPEWVELLFKPILEGGLDYVAPLYLRHKFDGTITNSIVYPVTRALYGKRIRQPIGGDFGFSGRLARFFLSQDVWETDVARYGIDVWMTTTAVANGYKVCQAFLGAKIHDPKDPGTDLSEMLFQVVGATFDLTETYANVWKAVTGSEPVPTFGFTYAVGLEPVTVNLERMLDRFRLGVRGLMDMWQIFLPQDAVDFLTTATDGEDQKFHFPDDIWARIVYSFGAAIHKRLINREHLLRSLTPLYLGRVASFVLDNQESDADEVEDSVEALCARFEEEKSFLLDRWG